MTRAPHRSARLRGSLAAAAAAVALGVQAAPFIDAGGDFLPTYAGPHDPALDVRFADVVVDRRAGTITFSATVAGRIDPASTAFYVFGIDRGRGDAGRDLVFQGPLGGEPKIGSGVRWDAALGLTAAGQAVFFDALHPGIVPLPEVTVRVAGSEISATVPLALFPSQGLDPADYGFNLWPRSQVSLANTTVADFAPDDGDAQVGVVGRHTRFPLVRSARTEAAGCLAGAGAEVTVRSVGAVEVMDVAARGLPPRASFGLFLVQQADAPFGLSSYLGDLQVDRNGRAHQRFIGRFGRESFSVAPGGAPAPVLHQGAIADATIGPATGPVHQLHLGLWFDSPAAAVRAGCPGDVTPFGGDHAAGVQALGTRQFPALQGPLAGIDP